MAVNIIIFGQLTDITGEQNLVVSDVRDTDQLIAKLNTMFPAMSGSKYVLAVDKRVISDNTILENNSTIALLPPFSGG
jgi:molybdopterin converting factor small subunit